MLYTKQNLKKTKNKQKIDMILLFSDQKYQNILKYKGKISQHFLFRTKLWNIESWKLGLEHHSNKN